MKNTRNRTAHPQDRKSPNRLLTQPNLHSGVEAIEATHPLLENSHPFAPGLFIARVDPACHLAIVPHILVPLVTDKSPVLGIPASKVESIFSLVSGNFRQIEQAKNIAGASIQHDGVSHRTKYIQSPDKVIWTNPEGLLNLFRHFSAIKGSCLIVDQVIPGPTAPTDLVLNLNRISTKAKEADLQVIMIISAPAALTPALKLVCDEYLEVTPCEADLDVQMAFSIDYPCISDLGVGLGKVMCSIKYADGKYHYSYTPFISDSLDKRIVWTMRGLKKTLEEIGAKLKINKSTVR